MKVLFFAQLRDITGRADIELTPAAALSSDALWNCLIELYPGLAMSRRTVRLARNGEYAGPETCFEQGDEVALIPPVSGG